jgi:NAD(P)H-dependent FMN reductase
MLTLQVFAASTRDARKGVDVWRWFLHQARTHAKFAVEAVDLAEINLPVFDEPRHPRLGQYEHDHTKRWSAIVNRADAFVFVTPEYNYGPSPSLVNALDYLHKEWLYKPVGFVSYGGVSGGTRGVQITKQIVTALKMMPMFEAVAIPFFIQYFKAETGTFDPGEMQATAAVTMLDELLRWANALRSLRET